MFLVRFVFGMGPTDRNIGKGLREQESELFMNGPFFGLSAKCFNDSVLNAGLNSANSFRGLDNFLKEGNNYALSDDFSGNGFRVVGQVVTCWYAMQFAKFV